MSTKAFDEYFNERTVAVTNRLLPGDELLVLRGGVTFKARAVQYAAFAGFDDNATETVISAVDVWTAIEGTLSVLELGDSFSEAGGVVTFTGPNQAFLSAISATISAKKMGGGLAEVHLGFFVNGTPVGLRTACAVGNVEIASTTTGLPYALQNGDEIQIGILNHTDGDNITVIDAQLNID